MTRLVIIDANDLLQLILHYNDGQDIPLNTRLLNVGMSPYLQRWVALMCEATDWPTGTYLPEVGGLTPLHIRYEGKKIMVLATKGTDPTWSEAPDAPSRQ